MTDWELKPTQLQASAHSILSCQSLSQLLARVWQPAEAFQIESTQFSFPTAVVSIVSFTSSSPFPCLQLPFVHIEVTGETTFVMAPLGKPLNYKIIKIPQPDTDAFINTILMSLPPPFYHFSILPSESYSNLSFNIVHNDLVTFVAAFPPDTMLISICKVANVVCQWRPLGSGQKQV